MFGFSQRLQTVEHKCPICRGEGRSQLNQEVKRLRKEGIRRYMPTIILSCSLCQGTGVVEVKE